MNRTDEFLVMTINLIHYFKSIINFLVHVHTSSITHFLYSHCLLYQFLFPICFPDASYSGFLLLSLQVFNKLRKQTHHTKTYTAPTNTIQHPTSPTNTIQQQTTSTNPLNNHKLYFSNACLYIPYV